MLVFEIAFLVVAALMLAVDIIFLLSTLSGPWKSEEWRRKEREYRKKQKGTKNT